MPRCIILVSKIRDAVTYMLKNDSKKVKIILAIGLCGIVLISMSEVFTSDNDNNESSSEYTFDYIEYTQQTEEKLCDTISSIDGVGECKVMITFESTNESVYATDSENNYQDDSQSSKDEYVIYDSNDGETPILIEEIYPTVLGVSVVCSGGEDVKVKENIINTVTSLFNISANRVSVSKIKTDSD